ncbi:TPA: elongation factor G [Candidatus Poribacteria bacterium]|nr:elongation factor G [Candidatus Poribacteria bacterium]
MREYRTERIRNIGIISHAGAGKTSLIEAMLYDAGVIERMGRVNDGNTVADYDEEDKQRQTTVIAKICIAEWNGHKINIIDTPGAEDFYGDLESALRVVDSLIVVVDATTGVEGGTEKVWQVADKYELPRMIFVNKMDEEQASFEKAVASIKEILDAKTVLLQFPIGRKANFAGVVDLVKSKALKPTDETGKDLIEDEIPDDLQDQVEEHRMELIETAAEGEDELIEKYLSDEELTSEEIIRGLKVSFLGNRIVPVMCGSAYNNVGIQPLLETISLLSPSPAEAKEIVSEDGETILQPSSDAPLSALVFKTMSDRFGTNSLFRVYSGTLHADSQVYNSTKGRNERIGKISFVHAGQRIDTPQVVAGDYGAVVKLASTSTGDTLCDPANGVVLPGIEFPKPVISMAVLPKREGDDEKLSTMLARMSEEDPTFKVERDSVMKQLLISGLGELHLISILGRMQRKYNIEADTATPKVAYKETIRSAVNGIQGRYKRQSGGRGQFGEVWINIEPMERGAGFEFVNQIKGGAIPQNFIPAVEKGVLGAMEAGVVAGYPVVDVRVTLYDGKTHPVDSSDLAFTIAGSQAFRDAMEKANPVMLEPIMDVEISVPEEYMGDIIGDLNSKRGRVMGMEQVGNRQVIKAQAPLAEMFRYSIDLRSMTSARGSYTMEFAYYEQVPDEVAVKIIAASKAEKEEE